MSSKSNIVWSMKELTESLKGRQHNKFDCNIGVSGKRGNGKSTLLFKIFKAFKKVGFKQSKHQVYSRDDVMKLLSSQKFGFCWDDEAINSGYKRDFQTQGQKDLIKLITNYRDNFNIYASALPFFYSLDKDLRELIFIHIHIIERGVAVILMPLEDQIHMKDPWDSMMNIKIEQKENKRIENNPDLQFRYHKLTTFAGYLYFGEMTKREEATYRKIKQVKRAKVFEDKIAANKEETFVDKLYRVLLEGKLSREGLIQGCYLEGKSYSAVVSALNQRLKSENTMKTVQDYIIGSLAKKNNAPSVANSQVNTLIPSI